MVNVKLADVSWDEATVLTELLLVDCIRILQLDNVALVDCLAPIPAIDGSVLISEFNLGLTTD